MTEIIESRPDTNELNDTQPPHELLPTIDQLQPIVDKNSTFSDTYFNKPFEQLEFGDKLRVVADILRQSVLPAYYSDPSTEQQTFTGDCHATSHLAIQYLQYLGVGQKHEYAMVNRRPFDPPEKTYSKHAIVIVTDHDGSQWQLDSAPWMGYGYGTVSQIGTADQVIDDYSVIDEKGQFVIDRIKDLRVIARTDQQLTPQEISYYHDIIAEGEGIDYARGFVGEAYAALALQTNDSRLKQAYADKALELDPYRGANTDILPYASQQGDYAHARTRLQEFTEIQCQKWEAELQALIAEDSESSLERQLQLAQLIVNERKFSDPSLVRNVTIGDREYPATSLTPRFMKEMGLNTAIIKPSSYFIGSAGTVRETLRRHGIKGEYSFDPTTPTDLSGITPLLFSHSLAKQFERSYTGKNTVAFVESPSQELYDSKKRLRQEIGNRIVGKQVQWHDGKAIDWHPYSMNYLHTTDNPQEAALHGLFGMPEFSPMNRWMYPNPNLV